MTKKIAAGVVAALADSGPYCVGASRWNAIEPEPDPVSP
jgi:hypothetical protein